MAQFKSLSVLGNIAVLGNIVVNGKLDINKLNIPTSSGATTLGPGANGQVLKSNGTSVYWGIDNNDVTDVAFTRHVTTGVKLGTITINGSATDIYSGSLPLSGGTMTGPIVFDSASGSNKSSNYLSAGGGYATGSGRLGLKIVALDQSDAQMGLGVDLTGGPYELTVATSRSSNTGSSKIVFATHTTGSTAYKTLATLSSSGAENPTATFNVVGTIQENGTALSKKYLSLSGGTLTGNVTLNQGVSLVTGGGYNIVGIVKDGMYYVNTLGHTSGYTKVTGSATVINNVSSFTLKGSTPTVGQVLTASNTSGALTWATPSDTKVTQAYSKTSNSYPLLMTATAGVTSTSTRGETTAILNNNIYANPNTGRLYSKYLTCKGHIDCSYLIAASGDGSNSAFDSDAYSSVSTIYWNDLIYIEAKDEDGNLDEFYLNFPAKSGTLATTSDIPKYLHTCEVTCTYSGNGTKATVFFSFYSTKSTAYNKLTFANDISVMGRVYPATGYIKANSLGLSIVQYIRFLATAGSSTVYIKYLNENILGTFPTEVKSSFSDLKDTVTTIS